MFPSLAPGPMSVCNRCLLTLWFLAATPARAETPMTAAEFDAFSLGQTLDYRVDGQLYGSEMHLPGRRVRDADVDGPCREGYWFSSGTDICFVYEAIPGEHCWQFWRDGDGLIARTSDSGPDDPVSEVTIADSPLACAGPDVGV
jgi:hypothetical protein